MKVLLDTNIYISAFLFKGKPRSIIEDLSDGKFTAFISKHILEELEATLIRPKFKLKANVVFHILQEIKDITSIVINKPLKSYHNLRDRNDFHILETAFSAKVDYLVTGDKDLLSLQGIDQFKIISPDQFVSILSEHRP